MFERTRPSPNGNTAQAASAGPSVSTGAMRNRVLLAPLGMMISLEHQFDRICYGLQPSLRSST